MEFSFSALGHYNVTSKHKSTLEITLDPEIGKAADCIIGVSSQAIMEDIPVEIRKELQSEKNRIKLILKTENAEEEIIGFGHPNLTLDHPTDMVCRKSEYICSRTLMIRADKAAKDLNHNLVKDLKAEKPLKVTIRVENDY